MASSRNIFVPVPESNRASAHARPPWWFRLVRALLNLALVCLLCLQAFVLVILWTDNHLSLPGFVRHALEGRLQDQGLSVRFRSLEVSLSGRLLLREPQIYLTGAHDPIAEADYLEIDPDWLALWWSHQFAFSELRLFNASLFCPPESSPTGVREAVIQRLDIALASQGHRWWLLDHLRAQFLNADIQGHGTFLWPPIEKTASAAAIAPPVIGPKPTLGTRFRQWANAAVNLQPQFVQVSNPFLQISAMGEESGSTKISATILATGAKLSANGLILGKIRGWGNFIWDGRTLRAAAPIMASTESMRLENPSTAAELPTAVFSSGEVWVRVEPEDGAAGLWSGRPKRLQVSATFAKLGDFPTDIITADVDLRQWPQLSLAAFVTRGQDSLKLSGFANVDLSGGSPDLHNGQINFIAQVAVPTFLVAGHWSLPPGLGSLKFDDRPQVDGQITFGAGHRLDSLDWTLHVGGAHFQQINLDQIIAHGRLTRDQVGGYLLNLPQISLINKSWEADGSYFENLRTREFRLLAHGSLDPAVLNPYMGEWWQPLWQFIVPQGQWPQADAEFSGNWDGPWWAKDLFVYAQISGPHVQGIPIDSIRVRVIQRPEYIAVYDLAAHASGGGDLAGAMIWGIKPAEGHIVEQRYFFDSTLPLAAVAAIAGTQVADVVKPLDCPVPPTIRVDQRTGTSFNPQPDAVSNKVYAEFSAPFRIFNVPLDRASVDIADVGGITDIPRLNFGIAGGAASGKATITQSGGAAQMDFNVLLQNARQADFMTALGQFDDSGSSSQPDSGSHALKSAVAKDKGSVLSGLDHPGLLDLALGGQFDFGQPDSLLSTGQVRIHDAQLGQLQLFGRLSKLLADTKAPLGDFDLHSAVSDLQIAQQYLRLPNLVVTGPSARIQAAGIYHFNDGELNFNTLIFPIGQWDAFLLKQIASIANPFVNTITLKLHGQLDKPAWEISMNPLRLFENRTVEGPPIPGMQTDATGAPILPVMPAAPSLPDLPPANH